MVRNIDTDARTVLIAAPQLVSQRTVGGLDRLIDDAITQRPEIVDLAMGTVQGLDSVGLGWLVSVQERLAGLGMKLRLADPTELVQDILLATRLDTRFAIHCSTMGGRHA